MYPVLLFLCTFSAAHTANILGVFPITSFSHQIVYRTLMQELNLRGHNITVITPNPVKDPTLRNYTEIDVSFFYDIWNKKFVAKPKELRIGLRFPELLFLPFVSLGEEMCHAYLSHPRVREFVKHNPKYDLVIWEFGVLPCLYGFTKFSNHKHIGIFSFQASSVVHSALGNPSDPAYIPEVYFPFFGKFSFFEKMRIMAYQGFMWMLWAYVVTSHEVIAKKYFGDLPGLIEVEKNLSALMVNTHFTMGAPRPNVPRVIEIGGPAFHLARWKPKPLPKISFNVDVENYASRVHSAGSRMHGLTLTGLLLWGAIAVHGSNILVFVPTSSYSHQLVYRAYTLELQRRGHNLTVITPNSLKDPTLTNYREIDIEYMYERMRKMVDISSEEGRNHRIFAEALFPVYMAFINDTCHSLLSDPNVFDIYRKNERFDLVVFEYGIYTCFYPFGKLADWKMLGIGSYVTWPVALPSLGTWWNPSISADPSLDYTNRMTFLQRLRSTVFYWNSFLYFRWLRWHETNIAKKYFGPGVGNTLDLEAKFSLVMDNHHFTMSYPRAASASLIGIGGPAFHLNGVKIKPLPKDLKEFMDDAPHGVIYFSLGTNVKTHNMPTREEEHLLETFRRLKQKIVWKWENDNLKVNLDNVYKGKWFPQTDVLAHPNVKAFVTQAGLQSLGEAVNFKVPMVAMPFFADQGHNAKRMELAGVAIVYDIDYLHADTFTEALNQIIYNKTYKENMDKFHELVKDQPMPPLEKAIWWTEYVIRHDGAPHLRSAAATMPWYQYFLLDVLAFLFAVIFIILYIPYRIFKYFTRSALSKSKKD